MMAAMDPQTQTHGAISVLFQIGDNELGIDVPSMMALSKLDCSIPVHWTAFHFCQEAKSPTGFPDATKVLQLAMNTMSRIKLRIHRGTSNKSILFGPFLYSFSSRNIYPP